MLRRLALACAVTALAAGCAQSRTLSVGYTKSGVDDVAAAKDRAAFAATPGVTNVTYQHDRDGTARVFVYVEDGKELAVYGKADELGYARMK